ncbi:cyclohexanone monooxygenase [Novosphingobium chloroacetimidivorans]|uniref:Cyclohexanone monooxygenase n=1 Tax=Novosphingobium chloroacetimidivorans TaxID=1428314 RepID=A0A7W7NWR8_9SPHN|nr:NAD(P)/FAD-dependent oxidoreductase [Novosphingobium chloroacetimidivorans]MBB4858440.1 cyclohexanone monooxygenase [Novosphingobium chloroacetimidivorans]
MNCLKSIVPAPEEIDIPALKAKYAAERDKRMPSKVGGNYAAPEDHLVHDTREHDPFTPVVPRDAVDEDIEVAILGAGWTGVLAGFHLTRAGITDFRHIEHAGGFGGTWYWNRYPGIQCDNDAYCYLPLLEEMGTLPSKKFADGKEIYDYIQTIVDKFEFRDKALLHTEITAIQWDESIKRYRIATNRGDTIRAQHVIMCGGTLSTPKFPSMPGLHKFKGKMFHTSRWDFEYTGGEWGNPVLDKLADKRVAILGTGATSIQAVPYLGKYAKQLYVIQRTPSSVDERPNPPTDQEWAASLKPGWQAERQTNFLRAANEIIPPGDKDLICDIWTEINRNLNAELEEDGWPQIDFNEFMQRREVMDFRVMERLRKRVESIVEDPETAEALKPYYRFMCKRPLSNNDYYPTFNRPNVKLIDVSKTAGLEAMTENGFIQDGQEYEIDCMIFASGFEVTSDLKRRWGIEQIEGRDGVSIYDHWADGPLTLNGNMTHHFPNMYFTGYIQGGLNGNTTVQFGEQARHAAWIIAQAHNRGIKAVEPTREGMEAYVKEFREKELDLSMVLNECTPSYFTNDGDKAAKWFLFRGWGPGWDDWQRKIESWRQAGDMPGMRLDA